MGQTKRGKRGNAMDSVVRLGVDIGGTFTDVALEGPSGFHSVKVLTSRDTPEEAIVQGLSEVCQKAGIKPSDIGQIVHGTTLATNALIERSGAKTALITTKGFRDVIEMRTESRFEQYDLNLKPPDPLLPRNRRYVLTERMSARGEALIPLDRQEVEALADELREAEYESIAVGLLHAYANDAHERTVRDVLAEKMPDAMVSLSAEVSPQMREYERFNTTIVNAYIKPLMKGYLDRLRARLASEGARCPVFLIHSGGGLTSLESAAEFPVRLVESGPAGGAIFAADIAARHGLDRALSFDMGGTTAKICLIRDATPKTSRVFEVARTYRFKKGSGMPISIPVIDMVEIGAGGGSIAAVDSLRRIRVGPESAGADPGPACYGLGGTRPTVTDADLIMGKLDPENFAGGSIPLHPDKARAALTENIGAELEMDDLESARGLAEMVDENMANAARMHAVENGEDLAEYTMIAFGGAAPLHAARLCGKLGVRRWLVPPGAGVGSAIGFLRAPFGFEANRTVFMPLSEFVPDQVRALFDEMEVEAAGFVRSCGVEDGIRAECKVYMRYAGQGWEIPVPLPSEQVKNPDAETFRSRFEEEYATLFGRSVEGMEAEITVWAVNAVAPPATSPVAPPPLAGAASDSPADTPVSTRSLFDAVLGRMEDATVHSRAALASGAIVPGPAVIAEAETAVAIPSGARAVQLADGCIAVESVG